MDTGSGFVHIARDGFDDWVLGVENGLAIPETVMGDGVFADHVPLLGGNHVLSESGGYRGTKTANALWLRNITLSSLLLQRTDLRTPQWFISMENNGLRETAIKAIGRLHFIRVG